MTSRDIRLFEILKDHTIKNAREIAHDIWKDGDEDGIHDDLIAAINRCENGTGTDADLGYADRANRDVEYRIMRIYL